VESATAVDFAESSSGFAPSGVQRQARERPYLRSRLQTFDQFFKPVGTFFAGGFDRAEHLSRGIHRR
jgi:hypothetical protein